jgi:hypothetical protein
MVLKLRIAELFWPSFLASCASSAAIEAATQLMTLKSWFKNRLIAISELLCTPIEWWTLLTVFSAAAALRATNGGGVRAIYNLTF